ncbi:hypothetical protein, partial [Pseudomonas aeruginosa]
FDEFSFNLSDINWELPPVSPRLVVVAVLLVSVMYVLPQGLHLGCSQLSLLRRAMATVFHLKHPECALSLYLVAVAPESIPPH